MTFRVEPGRYEGAPTFAVYLESVDKHADLWRGMYRTASVPPGAVEGLKQVAGSWRFLVLSEDWCADCFSTLPVIARLAEQANVEMKVLGRDAHPDLIDAHLTSGTRSIPVVMVLDEGLGEWAWWGPRPAPLQRWMRAEALLLSKEDRSRRKRSWYARDRGKTVVSEVVESVERAARRKWGAGNDGQ